MKFFDTICSAQIIQVCLNLGLKNKNNKGVALLFTFMILVAMTISTVAYISLVQYSTRNAGNQVSDSQAFSLAEAGLHKAIWYLINGNTAPDGSTDSSWRTTAYPTAPGAGLNDSKQESFANGTYTMWAEASSGNVQITARGTMNGIERIIRQTFATATWTEITNDAFETDFGNWTDGGTDCLRYTGGTYAHEGSAAIDIQDNTTTSLMSTGDLTLAAYTQVKIDFWYYPRSMETNEDFWLQISTNGGGSYATDTSWARGTDFSNNSFYEESVTMTGYTWTDTTRIRFRVDASNNGDDVYFDEIVVSATADAAGTLIPIADSWEEL